MGPWASRGFQAEKPLRFCTAGLLILSFLIGKEFSDLTNKTPT